MKYPRTPIHDESEYLDPENIVEEKEFWNEDDIIERERDLKEGKVDAVIEEAMDDDADDLKDVL